MSYPEYVRINGEKVKIKSDMRTALKCLKVAQDNNIGGHERALAIIYILYGDIPEQEELWADYIAQAVKFLQRGEECPRQSDTEPDMDLFYDEEYISASFMSDYHIDLSETNMHFWKFCDLVGGLTENCILSRVRAIRTADIKDYAEKDRRDIIRAKEKLALPHRLTKEEQQMEDEFEAQFKRGED